ncbi:MAG: succinate dehydrogenase assembly factor 2 [Pseudomonadota bacterium]
MTETMRSSAGLDPRKKRLLYRAWHRGMREMDYVLGTFANEVLEGMADDELDDFEQLMTVPDPDMYKWLSGTTSVPPNWDTALVRRIRTFHAHADEGSESGSVSTSGDR